MCSRYCFESVFGTKTMSIIARRQRRHQTTSRGSTTRYICNQNWATCSPRHLSNNRQPNNLLMCPNKPVHYKQPKRKNRLTPPTILLDGPPCMVKQPIGSGGEPSSPNCGASARIRLVNPPFFCTLIALFPQVLAGRIPSQRPCIPSNRYLHSAPSIAVVCNQRNEMVWNLSVNNVYG
jgi:hypothetical protein